MSAYYHYTCSHSRAAIGEEGTLLPPADLIDPSAIAKWPAWRRAMLDLIWMTDLDSPIRAGLGLTRNDITCDRTRHRYRAVDYQPMRYLTVRRDLPKLLRDDLESAPGVLPAHWFLAYTPVPVVYDPVMAAVPA